MDMSMINSSTIDTTLEQAKYTKKAQELEKFKTSLSSVDSKELTIEEDTKLKEMCKEFEQYFVKEMYKSMKKTINYDNFMGYSQGEEIFSDMLDDKYAESAAENGSLGLAKMLYNQLKTQNSSKVDNIIK